MPLADPAALGEVKLFPTVSAETDFFGDAAVMEGSTLVFGASANVSMGTLPGSAHVFELVDAAGNGWSAPTELEPYDDTDPISYGQAVALDGDVLVIGARRSSESGAGTGAAYVLARDPMGGGAWADTAKLLPSLPEVGAHFGTSVAVSGDHVAVGAPDGSRGTVFVYGFDGASWVEQAVLQRPTDIGSDLFGRAVALVDGLLVVGDPAGGDAVFVYEEDAGTWTLLDSVAPSPNRAGGGFGFAIDLDPSGTFVVGAPVGDGVDVEVGVAFVSTKRPQGETGRKSRSCWMPEVCGPTASAAQWRSMVTGSESVRRGESTRCPIRDRSSSIDGSPGRAANG